MRKLFIVQGLTLRTLRGAGDDQCKRINWASQMQEHAAPNMKRTAPTEGHARDVFVLVAMAIVVAALGFGLYYQLDVSGALAALTAGLAYAVLVSGHMLVRRSYAVENLNAEVVRLNAILAEARHGAGTRSPMAARPDGMPNRGASMAAGGPGHPNALPRSAKSGPSSSAPDFRGKPAMPGAPMGRGGPLPLPHAANAGSGMSADRLEAVASALTPSFPPADQSSGPPPIPGGIAPPALNPAPASVGDAPSRAPMPATLGSGASPAVMRALADAPTQVPPQTTPAGGAPFWGLSLGAAPDAGPTVSSNRSGEAPTRAADKATAPPPPPSLPPRKATTESVRPTASSVPPATGSELDTMQALIDQLAAQLTAPRPGTPPTLGADAPISAGGESAVDHSISALKSTGDVMRRSIGLESAPRTTPPPLPPAAKAAAPKLPVAKTATPPVPAAPPAREPMSYRRLSEIEEAVSSERVDFYLDPILGLSDRKARHFEVSVRLRTDDGGTYDRRQFAPIAQGTGILARIDAIKLQGTAKIATRLAARGTGATLFSNVAGESLSDDVFMESFDDLVTSVQGVGRRLILSFSQDDVRTFTEAHWKAVTAMSRAGIRFALEEVTDLDMDFEKLKASGFEFIKLDALVFLAGLPAPDGAIPAADLCRHLAGLGLSLIVGAIDDERNLAKILGFGVLFGQGTLFGGARRVKLDGEAASSQPAATLSR